MSEISILLERAAAGDQIAAGCILPLVYDELKRMAANRINKEMPCHTLNATALVHEAYIRLNGKDDNPQWQGRAHFFGAAAEAMRRILVDHARHRGAAKRSGHKRVELDPDLVSADDSDENMLALHDALDRLEKANPRVAELIKLRYFGGLTIPAAASVLNVSQRTANSWWTYGRAWLAADLRSE